MDEAQLARRLAALTPPELREARERAILAARVRLAQKDPNGAAGRRSRWRPIAAAAICLAALAAGIVSPPGQAVADWVAGQLGIGQPGGPPSLKEFRTFVTEGSDAEGVPAFVLARGPLRTTGGHYEFITWHSRREGARCYEVMLVDPAGAYAPACSSLPPEHGLTLDLSGSTRGPDLELQTVAGRVSEDVAAVRVEFNRSPVSVQLKTIDPDLLAELGIDRGFKFYFAEITDFLDGGRVEIEAIDGSGAVVAHRSLKVHNYRSMLRWLCSRSPDMAGCESLLGNR